ncbi:TetR/AcrR family transcriptional regulator [Micromonospora sp. NBC_01699]|uniref:TetR/AcrR family transcriptional regulator n=1 Tax=Micromonospora sp. NBC_01699 TaxID=2975984 RepID=UPI002E290B55|nr:helix-turn-helix domain-containing protein [Micromonospora sp. NBC_01699]
MRHRSQERIIGAALEVFAAHGYEGATISQITDRAAVSRGLISYYFASKRDLLEAVLGRWLDAMLGMLDDQGPEVPADQLLATVIDRALFGARGNLETQRLMLCLMLQPGTREVFARVERSREATVRAFEDRVRAIFVARGAVDPAVEEVLLRSLLEGVVYKLAVYEDIYPLTEVRNRLYVVYQLGEPGPLPLPPDTFHDTERLRAPV